MSLLEPSETGKVLSSPTNERRGGCGREPGDWVMRRTSLIVKAVVVALSATLIFGVSAQAASFNVGTTLTLQGPSRRVNSGGTFTLKGKLTSPRVFCIASSDIQLYADGVLFATTTTGPRGRYTFTIAGITSGTTYHTQFDGKMGGTHPETKVCRSSSSNAVRVKVRRT